MAFLETPRFPFCISYGAVGGPEFATDIVEMNSGVEQRNVRWSQARNRYSVEFPLVDGAWAELLAWFRSVRGRADGFRLRDWADYQVSIDEGRLGMGANASGMAVYQLYKYYSSGGALEEYRKISKPAADAPLTIYRGGVLQTAGAGAGNYALDPTTGTVTFVADASAAASAITVGTTTTVVLSANLGLIAGQQLYLLNFAGADAALVNGLAHPILSVSGAGPYTFVLDTDTAGTAITLGSGVGRKYAQAGETLAWAGTFDVPVRFESDYAAVLVQSGTREGPNVYRVQNMSLVELRI